MEKIYIKNKSLFKSKTQMIIYIILFCLLIYGFIYLGKKDYKVKVSDNERFASILNSGKFDYESLKTFMKILNYLKLKIANGDLTEKDQKYVRIVDSFAMKLVNYFKKYNGVSDQSIIINKINEVISYEPELISIISSKHTR